MLLEEGLVAGFSLVTSVLFWSLLKLKCSSRSLCSDRKSNSNGLLIYVSFVQSSVVHIAPSGYVITFELLINAFPFKKMFDTIAYWIDLVSRNDKVFYFRRVSLCIQGLFLIYLLLALFIHRKDRKELERISISMGVDVKFKYSWRGVENSFTLGKGCDSSPFSRVAIVPVRLNSLVGHRFFSRYQFKSFRIIPSPLILMVSHLHILFLWKVPSHKESIKALAWLRG